MKIKNNKVTIRFRDTAEQQIMDIDEAIKYIEEKTRI